MKKAQKNAAGAKNTDGRALGKITIFKIPQNKEDVKCFKLEIL